MAACYPRVLPLVEDAWLTTEGEEGKFLNVTARERRGGATSLHQRRRGPAAHEGTQDVTGEILGPDPVGAEPVGADLAEADPASDSSPTAEWEKRDALSRLTLAIIHGLLVFGIVLCAITGISFYEGKWTRMSTRLFEQPLSRFLPSLQVSREEGVVSDLHVPADSPSINLHMESDDLVEIEAEVGSVKRELHRQILEVTSNDTAGASILGPEAVSVPSELDVSFISQLLNEPVPDVGWHDLGGDANSASSPDPVGPTLGNAFTKLHPHVDSANIKLSVFVMAAEKRALLHRTRLLQSLPVDNTHNLMDFGAILLCTGIHPSPPTPSLDDVDGADFGAILGSEPGVGAGKVPAGAHRILGAVEPLEEISDAAKNDLLAEVKHDAQSTEADNDYGVWNKTINILHGSARTCVLWRNHGSQLTVPRRHTLPEDVKMPRLIRKTRGLITPNYPFRRWVELATTNFFCHSALILLIWGHSMTLPQPVSVVHAPRLVVYLILSVWRAVVLYYGAGLLEALPWTQDVLSHLDERAFQLISNAGCAMGHNRVTTKAMALSRFFGIQSTRCPSICSEQMPSNHDGVLLFDSSDHLVLTGFLLFVIVTEAFCAIQFRRRRKKEAEEGASPPIDNPLEMSKGAACIYLVFVSIVVTGYLYSVFLTAAFFHTPFEVVMGLVIFFIGIVVPFWAGIALDTGLLRHYFGLAR